MLLWPALPRTTSSTSGRTQRQRKRPRDKVKRYSQQLTPEPLESFKSAPDEELFIGTAESEHVEMYLKAIWFIRERGDAVKISSIAKLLNVTQPSVVQMLRKLNGLNLVRYGKGYVELT